MAILLQPNGDVKEVRPANKKFTLTELYDLIGCTIVEVVHMTDGRLMWIDEEGKLKGAAFNAAATTLARSSISMFDVIVGTAVICDEREVANDE